MTASAQIVANDFATTAWRRVLAGIVGGIVGGLVFGVLMAAMGMLPMVAALAGSDSYVVGFGIHLAISVVIGLGLTVPFGAFLTGYARAALAGLLYGAAWWVLGPLLIMPTLLGMPPFTIDANTLLSLMGHLIYGVVLGFVSVRFLGRRR